MGLEFAAHCSGVITIYLFLFYFNEAALWHLGELQNTSISSPFSISTGASSLLVAKWELSRQDWFTQTDVFPLKRVVGRLHVFIYFHRKARRKITRSLNNEDIPCSPLPVERINLKGAPSPDSCPSPNTHFQGLGGRLACWKDPPKGLQPWPNQVSSFTLQTSPSAWPFISRASGETGLPPRSRWACLSWRHFLFREEPWTPAKLQQSQLSGGHCPPVPFSIWILP